MAAISPIPSGRTTSLLIQQRMLHQLQAQQSDLTRFQEQISSGRRLTVPSDDAPAAIRGMALQRLLEQKAQFKVNLQASQSYLAASEQATASASDLLNEVRGLSLSLADTTTSPEERDATLQRIDNALQQLVAIGNQQFRGRHLFGGSQSLAAPYERVGNSVAYLGNEQPLGSLVDVNRLFENSVPGSGVFGGISHEKRGTIDLGGVISSSTLLADLRGGDGITPGSIAISDGIQESTIDIRGAVTVRDLIERIERSPPTGREVRVRLAADHLEISLDAAGGGNLVIRDVEGRAAQQLGIEELTGVGTGPVVGQPLDPRLTLTTSLSHLAGSRAIAYLTSAGSSNDIVIQARHRGAALNGTAIQFVDDSLLHASSGLAAGNEIASYSASAVGARASLALSGADNDLILTAVTPGTSFNDVSIVLDASADLGDAATVSYNSGTKVLTLHVDDTDQTTLGTLVAAINGSGIFTAAADPSNGEGYSTAGTVQSSDAGLVTGNTGHSGGDAGTIFIHIDPGATTAAQAVAALQANATVQALFETRLDDRDSISSESPGSHLVDLNATATTANGSGAEIDLASGIRITNGGQTQVVDLSTAETVEDLLNLLNGSGAHVLAEINSTATGINVRSRLSGEDFSVGENGGSTATDLGIRTLNRATRLSELNYGRGVTEATGTDFTIHRRDGYDLAIDISSARTLGDLIDLINGDANNQNPATRVVARWVANGNGLELVDENAAGTDTLTVTRATGSTAAIDLGLVARGQNQATAATAGSSQVLATGDVNPQETSSIFNALVRLRQAAESGDASELERATSLLDDGIDQITFRRAEIGARQQTLDSLQSRLTDDEIQLKGALSDEIDTDLADAIAQLTARQAALEASLRLIGQTFQLTLLNFL